MVEIFATDRVREIYPQIKAFLEAEVYPIDHAVLFQPEAEQIKTITALREKVKQRGWLTPQLEKHAGGLGFSLVEFAQINELLGSSPIGHYIFNAQAPDSGNMELLAMFGSAEQKATYLTPLAKGEIRSCFAMTEPEFAGSNPTRMATRALKEGNEYVINGHKWFTSSADGAAFSIVMAITNPEAHKYQRASMIIVPTDTEGFELVRNISVMGDPGAGWFSHAEVRFNNCRVPTSNLIGMEGGGFLLAQERLGPGRIHHCMRWIGICERVFAIMCERAATRKLSETTFLGDQQIVQAWIAEERANINAARFMVLHAAKKMDEAGAKAARIEISAIKFFCSNVLLNLLDRAIQVHGALGVTDDTLLSFWYRHERGARIYDGADEVHKSVVARSILKQYGLDVRRKK